MLQRERGNASKQRIRSIGCLLVVVGFVMTGGCALSDRLILYPSNHPVRATGSEWSIDAPGLPGGKVEAFYVEVGGSGAVDCYVVAFTGNAARAEHVPAYVAQFLNPWLRDRTDRVGVLAVQYPGYGVDAKPGDATLENCAAAGRAAYRHLHGRTDGKPVLILGTSIGSTVALHLAASDEVPAADGLILEKPPSLRGIILGQNGWWNLWLLAGPVWWSVPSSADSDVNAVNVRGIPALIITATEDRVVAHQYQQRIGAAYAGPKQIVRASCGHNDMVTPSVAPGLIEGFDWIFGDR